MHLIKPKTRSSPITFLKRLPVATANKIKAVAMNMGPAYQKSVRDCLPNADVVFDRFHVMQNYSLAIKNQRRIDLERLIEKVRI